MSTKAREAALEAARNIPDKDLALQVENSILYSNDWVGAVKAFHALYECPDETDLGVAKNLSNMSDDRLKLRLELIEEEYRRELIPAVEARNEVEVADALGDLIYVVTGFALEAGIDLNAVIAEIQASNMTKLGEDGRVVRREDGKVLKGAGYVKPDIAAVLKYREE